MRRGSRAGAPAADLDREEAPASVRSLGMTRVRAHGVLSMAVLAALSACDRAPEPGGGEPPVSPAAPRRAPSAPPAPPTGAAASGFTERFLAYVRRTHPEVQVRATGELEVTIEGGAALPLANLTAECAGAGTGPAATSQCDNAMARWTRVLLDTTHPPAAPTREAVRAALFPASTVVTERARARRERPDAPMPFVGRPWVGPIWIAYVLDSPDAIATMTSAEQDQLALDEHGLHDLALENMRRAFPEDMHGEPFAGSAPGLRVLRPTDSYGAARLILHERWAPIAREVSGDLLAAGPARDVAIYTGSASPRDVYALRWLAQEMFQHEPHPMSPAVLKWTPEGWTLFDENASPLGPPPPP